MPRRDASVVKKQQVLRLQKRRIGDRGTWIECCQCKKWRFIQDMEDPSLAPPVWCCSMNPDKGHSYCDAPQQQCAEEKMEEFVYNRYTAGSVVWAKVNGYPWWPAIVDDDPDYLQFFWTENYSDTPSQYHVVFFGKNVSRSWVTVDKIMVFTGLENVKSMGPFLLRGKNYEQQVRMAIEMAQAALKMPSLEERLKKYCFVNQFQGNWDICHGTKHKKRKPDDEPAIAFGRTSPKSRVSEDGMHAKDKTDDVKMKRKQNRNRKRQNSFAETKSAAAGDSVSSVAITTADWRERKPQSESKKAKPDGKTTKKNEKKLRATKEGKMTVKGTPKPRAKDTAIEKIKRNVAVPKPATTKFKPVFCSKKKPEGATADTGFKVVHEKLDAEDIEALTELMKTSDEDEDLIPIEPGDSPPFDLFHEE